MKEAAARPSVRRPCVAMLLATLTALALAPLCVRAAERAASKKSAATQNPPGQNPPRQNPPRQNPTGQTTAKAVKHKTATPALPQPDALTLAPSKFELRGRRSRLQLVATGRYADNRVLDLTGSARFSVSDPQIVRVAGSVVFPVRDGQVTITAVFGDRKAEARVVVSGMENPAYVSFKSETLPALTKAGCNMGACHGSPSGKAGFRLSLRGFDPPLDVLTLRKEYFNRRTDIMEPAQSLILKKPLMEVSHGGGRRLHKGDATYHVLFDWISEGLRLDPSDAPDLVTLEVLPQARVLHEPGMRQQLRVNGHFSDGSVRDLTALTVFSSSNESVASVSPDGLVEKTGRGETAILARLLDKMSTASITFLEDVKGFAWTDPPANNFIDTLVFQKLKQLQILPSPLCSDEEFVRRAYLDAAGRLPRPEEALAFLNSKDDGKRDRLVDALVDSPDTAEFWTLKWCDILRANSKKLEPAGVRKFRRWIYESVLADKPLDQFARELLTARGSVKVGPYLALNRAATSRASSTC